MASGRLGLSLIVYSSISLALLLVSIIRFLWSASSSFFYLIYLFIFFFAYVLFSVFCFDVSFFWLTRCFVVTERVSDESLHPLQTQILLNLISEFNRQSSINKRGKRKTGMKWQYYKSKQRALLFPLLQTFIRVLLSVSSLLVSFSNQWTSSRNLQSFHSDQQRTCIIDHSA